MCAETCKHLFGGEGLEFLGNQDPASYPTKAGWTKYLGPGLSANLYMVKAILLEA